MAQTIYAAFDDPHEAERAAGALLDHGIRAEDLSILAAESYVPRREELIRTQPIPEEYQGGPSAGKAAVHTERVAEEDARHAERVAEEGITTTTGGDAASGAAKGAGVGLGVGILATLAAMTVPGFGIIIGGGALATAIGATAATTAAGAVAGGVTGYLKDQGVNEDHAAHYADTFNRGGAIVAIHIPPEGVDRFTVEGILAKYGATAVRSYA